MQRPTFINLGVVQTTMNNKNLCVKDNCTDSNFPFHLYTTEITCFKLKWNGNGMFSIHRKAVTKFSEMYKYYCTCQSCK